VLEKDDMSVSRSVENMEGSSRWDMKNLKIHKEDRLVCSKWRRLIRGTEGTVMTVGVSVFSHTI